ncbi:hypothetical protein C7R92_19090 [Brevibacillus porteri]|uniref:Uncharacterized protein n=1 Tax=Brevibacillus porteri TaxID=2126350 RepID=A0ABX5FLW7_9BACL|nr:hypothetical protein C7R92_19090 [Brevibacillus porteri]
MLSSRLFPPFVRAVSFQACDRTSVQLWISSCMKRIVLITNALQLEGIDRIVQMITKAPASHIG